MQVVIFEKKSETLRFASDWLQVTNLRGGPEQRGGVRCVYLGVQAHPAAVEGVLAEARGAAHVVLARGGVDHLQGHVAHRPVHAEVRCLARLPGLCVTYSWNQGARGWTTRRPHGGKNLVSNEFLRFVLEHKLKDFLRVLRQLNKEERCQQVWHFGSLTASRYIRQEMFSCGNNVDNLRTFFRKRFRAFKR